MRKISLMKLQIDREKSDNFMRSGNTLLSQQGGCPSGGSETPKDVFKIEK